MRRSVEQMTEHQAKQMTLMRPITIAACRQGKPQPLSRVAGLVWRVAAGAAWKRRETSLWQE